MKNWYAMKAKGAQKAEITIYDEIGLWGISAKDFANDLKGLGDIKVLDVHLNSPGGSVIDGITIFNLIKQHSAHVNMHIDGVALSMGSVIAMAGDFIYMAENALMMIHNPWGGASGDADELRKTADVMDKMKASMIVSYQNKSSMTDEEISAIMDAETWYSADEALEAGFIDEIAGAIELAASFDLDKFGYKNLDEEAIAALSKHVEQASTQVVEELSPAQSPEGMGNQNEESDMLTEAEKKAAAEKQAAELKAAMERAGVEALEKEDARKAGIAAIFGNHKDHSELMSACVLDRAVTVEAAKDKLLEAIGKGTKPVIEGGDVRIEVGADARAKFIEGASNAMAIRTGAAKDDGKNEFRSSTMLDLAKQSLKIAGVSTKGMDKMRIVGAAFTHSSSDFPLLLENSLGKELRNAYGNTPETWNQFCDVGSVPDFKQNSRIQLGSFNSLDVIPEGGEYEAGSFGEDRETIQAQTKGKMITLTRQMIINDDLSGFTRIARMMGRAAQRTIGNDAYALLKAGTTVTMSDGVVVFHATHGNLPAGAAPTAASFGAARTLMRKQKDIDGNDFINLQPSKIIAGVELEDTINVLLASETNPANTNSKVPNPVRNMAELITDPRLGATEWYMTASPNEAPLIEVAFLDGNQTPYLESMNGFTIDGVMWKVRLDYGLSFIDFRGGVKGNA